MRYLVLLFLGACSGAPLDFRVDPSFPDDATEGIAQAARDWNAITNGEHQITFRGDDWFISKEQPPGGWNGMTTRGKRLIRLAPNPSGVTWRVLAKHEFGHALGLRHLCGGQGTLGATTQDRICGDTSLGVMDPIHAADAFSAEDLAECKTSGACD